MHCPHHLVLVKPRDFAFNIETAVSNAFQKEKSIANHLQLVNAEFDHLCKLLSQNNIAFTVFDSPAGVNVPDAVFPNNWFAVMPSGELFIFPMFTANRRNEINPLLLKEIERLFDIKKTTDLSANAAKGRMLEGTGSMVFDHDTRMAYACESDRTSISMFEEFCALVGYTPVSFLAMDLNNIMIYHTNVVMSVGARTVIACMDALADPFEAAMVKKKIAASGKQLLEISFDQMNHFCGNVLQVLDKHGQPVWLMSTTAFNAFEPQQLKRLEESGKILHADISTIETIGGGSLRCMLAGIHAAYK